MPGTQCSARGAEPSVLGTGYSVLGTAYSSPRPPVSIKDALHRYEQEAVQAVCATGRYRCPYFTWGAGPPLVCIPGLADNRRSFVPLCSILSEQFRCIAYDLPSGRGDGAKVGRYTHDDLVADAHALLDHLGLDRAFLFGSSFGSTVALAALHARPERWPRAVLQGGFAWRPLAPAELLLARMARYWPGSLRRLPWRRFTLRHCHYPPFADREPEFWDFFLEQCGARPIRGVAHNAVLLHRVDLRAMLPSIRQPVLLVAGDCDPLVNSLCQEALLQGLPNAVRVDLTGCGHHPLFTHPEVLAEVVRRFLLPPPCAGGTPCEHGG